MWISRIRVTGGYLHGLDVTLSRGLNVVVGPRGAGKTALLEFLRHALAAEHADRSPEAERQRASFLRGVLGAGEIIVDVTSDDGGRHLVVDAKGTGQRVDLSRSVLVLGQNELEGIASDAPARLNLLDLRTRPVTVPALVDPDAVAHLTTVLFDIRAELEERLEEADKRTRLLADQELLASQEAVLLGRRGLELAEKRESLRAAEELVIGNTRERERLELLRVELQQAGVTSQEHLTHLLSIASRMPGVAEAEVGRAVQGAEQTHAAVEAALDKLSVTSDALRDAIAAARDAAAPIRDELEKAEAGLGQITGQLRNINVALRSLDDNDQRVHELRARQDDIRSRRSRLLDEIEHADELIFRSRLEVAQATSSQVSANVVVVVDHLADTTSFTLFLQNALKGSSTRGVVIEAVADRVLPRQLLELVESRDAAGLAAASGLALDRAAKLVTNLEDRDTLARLVRVRLEDMVDFRLRDGAQDKSVDQLSTGQKCSVTLPIVMSERDRSLILDQPEDHLDNAFLVSNVVSGLTGRTLGGAQTIVATHNANIPVLGAADNVIVLTSDGTTGAVDVQGPFDAPDVVDRITRIMEGGREAFARRSSFYSRYGGPE